MNESNIISYFIGGMFVTESINPPKPGQNKYI
jgi:hypothetical protein